jgi:hypothetical protein
MNANLGPHGGSTMHETQWNRGFAVLAHETQWNRGFAVLAQRLSLVDELLRTLIEAAGRDQDSGGVDPAVLIREIDREGVNLHAEKRMQYQWRAYERIIRRFDQENDRVTNHPQPDWVFTTSRMAVMVENKFRPGLQNQQLVTYRNLLLRHEAYKDLPLKAIILVGPERMPKVPDFRSLRRWFLGQVEWGEVIDRLVELGPASGPDQGTWREMLQMTVRGQVKPKDPESPPPS